LRYLIQNGYTLVERNYRTRRGEIDLIVSKDDTLVLVLRNKAIPKDAGDVQRAVGGHLDREPEHLVDVVTLLGA
jgi:Holliday junction resolvase-like predicted endonuclease